MPAFQPPIGYRIPYDADGSTGFYYNSGSSTPSVYSNGSLIQLNNTSTDYPNSGHEITRIYGLIFSHLWDIDGYYFNMYMQNSSQSFYSLQTSPDTTNGIDGTWTTQIANPTYHDDASYNGFYRQGANGITPILNVKGIKVVAYNKDNQGMRTWHLYGTPSPGENPDRLVFWKPTAEADAILDPDDLDPGDGGDIQRTGTYDMQFRIKNNSSTLTATDVVVSCELINDNSPPVENMYTFSYQGSAYAPTITIPSIAPGALSDDVDVRLEVAPNAQNITTSPRFRAAPTTMA